MFAHHGSQISSWQDIRDEADLPLLMAEAMISGQSSCTGVVKIFDKNFEHMRVLLMV